jgi:predicted metal-binding membrane protein
MIGTAARPAVARPATPRVVLAAIAAAWAVAIAAQLTGSARFLHHDALVHSSLSLPVAVVIFVVAWQLMIVAMMLPSTLPLIRLFRVASGDQPGTGRALAGLLAGYAAVWTAFGGAAFLGDIGLHQLVHRWPWLEAHPQVIAGSVLMLAGEFQFSRLKDKCLSECRHPASFLLQHYGRGADAAFRLGRAHGLFCLGCCWALMLVGFAAGVANLWWMAVLTAVMVFEKSGRDGDRGVVPIGIALIAFGGLVLIEPAWSALLSPS